MMCCTSETLIVYLKAYLYELRRLRQAIHDIIDQSRTFVIIQSIRP